MSTSTTSAPSRAEVRACARPCPRAPPVISATLPSSSPMTFPSAVVWRGGSELATGIDDVRRAGDVTALVGDEVEDGVGDVDRLDRRHRQLVERECGLLEVRARRVLEVGPEQP